MNVDKGYVEAPIEPGIDLVKEIKPMKYVELSRKLKKHHIMMKKI